MSMARSMVRTVAERVLGARPVVRGRLDGRRRQAFILAWHNIVPRGAAPAGERSLHTDQAAFGEQLDAITELLPVARLRDLLHADRPVDGPVAVLTFDDAYAGALAAGGVELRRRGLTATVFVVPSLLGRPFWWDAFADPRTGELGDALRERALTEWAGRDDRVRAGMSSLGRSASELPPHAAAADEELLREAARDGCFELASHTWSHPNLEALGPDERATEIRTGSHWLRERFPAAVPALALPYGRGARHAAEADGPDCRAVLRIEGGWASLDPRAFRILPRFNVPRGLSPGGLRLRLAGFLS